MYKNFLNKIPCYLGIKKQESISNSNNYCRRCNMETLNNESINILNEDIHPLRLINGISKSDLQENPFYICDFNDIIKKFQTWNSLMPRIEPHYAVKCNNHLLVLKVLAALGTGFDCASKSEIDQILALGVDPSRIIYAHTTKLSHHLRYAAYKNVDLLTFDNELELYKIKNLFPKARAVIRIRCDAKDAMCKLGAKFGCDSKTEAPELLRVAHELGIRVVGVSFHVGSGCKDIFSFYDALKQSRDVFDVASDFNYNFNLLDIGGGYPGDCIEEIYKYAKIINDGLDTFFPDESIKVISEPGTYFVQSAFTLACNVHSARSIVEEDVYSKKAVTKYMYYLNDGVFGSFNEAVSYNIIKTPILIKQYSLEKLYPSVLWGPTCDSYDKVNGNVLLPKLDIGDWLAYPNMGAYSFVVSTHFNNFEQPDIYNFISLRNWLLLQNLSANFTENIACNSDQISLT